MKLLRQLVGIALLWCVVAQGAQYTISLGTTGNDGTGDTLRTGGGKINTNFTYLFDILGTTNQINLGGTNIIRFTNECTVTTAADTNMTTVSGAGTAGANGTYRFATESYTNTSGTVGIYSDTIDWVLTNSSGAILYTLADNNQGPSGSWSTVTGANPAPTSTLGDLTNCTPILVLSAPISAVVTNVPSGSLSNILRTVANGTVLTLRGTNYTRGKVPTAVEDMYKPDWILTNRSRVIIEGGGTATLRNTNDGIMLSIWDCDTIDFENIIFEGTKTNANTYQSGGIATHGMIQCGGTNRNVRFKKCIFYGGNWFAFHAGYQSAPNESMAYWPVFEDCQFIANGHTNYSGGLDGGSLMVHPSAVVWNCVIEGSSRGIEPFTAAGSVQGEQLLYIGNTQFRNIFARGIFAASGQPMFANIHVEHCNFYISNGCPRQATGHILVNQAYSLRVANCTFTNLWQTGTDPGVNVAAGSFGNIKDVQIIGNHFSHVVIGMALGICHGGRIEGNDFRYVTNSAIWLYANDVIVANNHFEDVGLFSGAGTEAIHGALGQPSTNCVIQDNVFVKRSGGASIPNAWITIGAESVDWSVRNNTVRVYGGSEVPLLTDSGIRTMVTWPEKVVYPALVVGTYTNAENDTLVVIPVSGQRTNKLRTPFRGHTVTVANGGQNATAAVVRAMSGVIFNGSAFGGTNEMSLGTNQGASATFKGDGTNWFKIAGTP